MRDDHQWSLRSLLLAATVPNWLVGAAKAKSPAPKKQAAIPARAPHRSDQAGGPANEHEILADGAVANPPSHERLVEESLGTPAQSGQVSVATIAPGGDAAAGSTVPKARDWPISSQHDLPAVGAVASVQTATRFLAVGAGQGVAAGHAGPIGANAAAKAATSGQTPPLQARAPELASSGPVLVMGKVPTAPSVADLIGYMPSPTDPVGQPGILLCCGGCGYINCPTRLLQQGSTGGIQLNGQRPGSGLPDGRDYVPSGQARFGASTNAVMSRDQVAPFADWRENAKPVDANINQLPGGGETGTGTKFIANKELSGRLKTVTKPQAKAKSVAQLATATAMNPIVEENQKQGNPESEWGIDGAGDANIEGFATDISVNRGSTVNFKIDTDSNNYRIDIYRLGYYGGLGARKVTTIQHTGVQNQPNPLRDAATGAVDAGNWAVSASWAVPADAVSGVYIAKLVRQDGTAGENHIPFIVRDDSSQSDVIFQTSDTTWQAYNGWGGANLYGGNGPATGQGAGRSFAVSYNRPIATRGGVGTFAGPQDYLFGAEYAAISWLEENGYDVSYMAGVDTDRHGSLLLNHKLFLDVGHDEYWSGQQRANVEAARDAGVNLSFWSGNEVYWRTRWGTAFSADGTPYRTLICYKETWANSSIDPSNEWTGTFRDPRFSPPAVGGASPENALTGTIFQVDDVGNNLGAITIPFDDANLRFWRNTSVANLQPGQTATLTKNYLGYEWDEASDNGFDPAGLVRLSSTTLPVTTYLLDYGNTTGSATATHNLTLYRAPSGALVFGAGTVYWAWGLSDNHDLQVTPTDARVQQAMINLFADMGIQPATLQSGRVAGVASTDNTRPTSTINALGPIAAGSAVTISGTATDAGGGVIAGVEVSTDNGASWHPATGDETWTYSWRPQLAGDYTILSRAVDDSVNVETPSAGRTATVSGTVYTTLFAPTATPAVVNTTDASAVELGVKFQSSVAGTINGLRYYKSSQDTGTHTGALWSSTGTKLASLTFTNETTTGWQIATFSSPVAITPGVTYTASYHTNTGHYSTTTNYFTSNVTNGPLTAPAAGNGVFTYGSTSQFPTSTFQSTNFWVDVLFAPGTGNAVPTAVADTGDATEKGGVANGSGGSPATGNVLTNDTDPDSGDTKTVTAIRFGTTNGTLGTGLAG
ncbi:MAG TPA: N,N-dimethylformamidase beta subunit family domain-containing protein, partial [Rhizobiaceae bacterium]|nr:N,N-dimethylformamidase beta subunit family domain-containing protein [Rhizobiaceae bacterium]